MPKKLSNAAGQQVPPKNRKQKLQLDVETLRQYFCMPLFVAAQKLAVSTTTLQKQAREHGFTRWPHVEYLREQMVKKAENIGRAAKQETATASRPAGSPNSSNDGSCDSQSEVQGSGGSGSESHSNASRSSGKRSIGSVSQSGSHGSGSHKSGSSGERSAGTG
eukprot:CAMPEP_0196726774 /NCGR_PEP_ID=MMETSP1091-20130531/7947_1 /TAXON_ID=302021 /ORGANISM="Rhodomonas sp., Strain CCMP768" /LENGTH=162 /DNA_ID=CAMNT_0042069261 /DNA_START=9 /DNA_END=493 /DNA_ORIENTATION=+